MGYLSLSGLGAITNAEARALVDNFKEDTRQFIANAPKAPSVAELNKAWTHYLNLANYTNGKLDNMKSAYSGEMSNLITTARKAKDSRLAKLEAASASYASTSNIFTNVLSTTNPSNWAATPLSPHADWLRYAPNAKIASGHYLSADSSGIVRVMSHATGQVVASTNTNRANLPNAFAKNSAGKMVFAGGGTPGSVVGAPTAASTQSEGGVFSAIADVFKAIGQGASAAAPAVASAYQHKMAQEQQKTLQKAIAAGLVPAGQVAPATGLSTTAKVALGLGGTLLFGLILYKATRPRG